MWQWGEYLVIFLLFTPKQGSRTIVAQVKQSCANCPEIKAWGGGLGYIARTVDHAIIRLVQCIIHQPSMRSLGIQKDGIGCMHA